MISELTGSMDSLDLKGDDVYADGQAYLRQKRSMVIGISPGNPYYYNDSNLERLLLFAEQNANEVKMFLPDVIGQHNYRAVGSANPERSSRVKANRLRNKVKSVMSANNLSNGKFKYVDWVKDIESMPKYEESLVYIRELYATNENLREDVRETTEVALNCMAKGRTKGESDSTSVEIDIEEGAQYLLKELAFFLCLQSAYDNYEEFVMIYHRDWPVLENFFHGHYDGIRRRYMGYMALDCENLVPVA